MKYIKQCLWALSVLWQQKTISRANRLRLWRKSINLFICFLAFADRERPEVQLRGAIICAVLSALYDYETDWVPIKDTADSLYRQFLLRFVSEQSTRDIAWKLFELDRLNLLSEHGLERGSDALLFYRAVIGSKWLQKYSETDITKYGRCLQILDDLLDLEDDKTNGHKNCFLTSESFLYKAEVREFIESDFFTALESRSLTYHALRKKCQKLLGEKDNTPSTLELLKVCRLHTGIFAFLLTIVGFNLQKSSLSVGILTAFGFFGITVSIMVFNDLTDRVRDVKKSKVTAYKHTLHVFNLWKYVSMTTLAVLVVVAIFSWDIAKFCSIVWIMGLLYSVMKLDWPLNNILVAFCSASPVLVGSYGSNGFNLRPLFVFCIIFTTILFTEMVKDIQDMDGDRGYKKTVATKYGRMRAMMGMIGLCYLPVLVTMLYPDQFVRATALCFAGVMFCLALSFTRKKWIYHAELVADIFLGTLVIVLLFH